MSVRYRFPCRSNAGPSRKLSTSVPGAFAAPQSLATGRRIASGSRVSTVAAMTVGGAKSRFQITRRSWGEPPAGAYCSRVAVA